MSAKDGRSGQSGSDGDEHLLSAALYGGGWEVLPKGVCVNASYQLCTFDNIFGSVGHLSPLWPLTGEPAFSDPQNNLLRGQTLAVEGGVATQHGVLQRGKFITQSPYIHIPPLPPSTHQNDSETPEVTGLSVAVTW